MGLGLLISRETSSNKIYHSRFFLILCFIWPSICLSSLARRNVWHLCYAENNLYHSQFIYTVSINRFNCTSVFFDIFVFVINMYSFQFSHSVMSDSLRHHGLQHTSLPVHHQLPEFTQTHVHWVSDAIQPPHTLWSPSPPIFNLSQN